ncbi:HXXEE domain-containing protein [Mycolicibacterium septicum]|uniref:HXXEE domain-containing protein n=1 Tax=Mycolicibacterium septicum TaxID=98668 RepID=UPI0023610722|nr:HXXEE domain-containing protein [Mycolicibacterium septicum]
MSTRLIDVYRKEWPRVAAVQAMVLGGVSLLIGRKSQTNLRALSVMNAMTMCAHQYEEYVDPGWFPGMVNIGLFKSDHPDSYPFNAHSAMCANVSFRALYVPAMLFPKVKWLGLAPVLLGIGQAFGHAILLPRVLHTRYTPGALTAALLHVPIGVAYLSNVRAEGPITRSDWIKTALLLVFFLVVGVAYPNISNRDKTGAYPFTEHQMDYLRHRTDYRAPAKPVEGA